jgi:hypothetical protein
MLAFYSVFVCPNTAEVEYIRIGAYEVDDSESASQNPHLLHLVPNILLVIFGKWSLVERSRSHEMIPRQNAVTSEAGCKKIVHM